MTIPRVHAPELMDQAWWPDEWRRMETDFLRTFNGLARTWVPLRDRVASLMRATGKRRIVDLCSGGGGLVLPLREGVAQALGEPVELVLTDLYPNPAVLDVVPRSHGVTYCPVPVDARHVPPELDGVRTICLGLHHLRPADAAAVLLDAARARQPIVVFEGTARSLPLALSMALLPPVVTLLSPLSRPRSLRRLLWHTALPVVPLAMAWDGFCSCLRSYEPEEFGEMTADAPPGYRFEIGRERWLGLPITWLVGYPADAAGAS